METKKYLQAITGDNKALFNFLSKENLMDLAIFDIKIDENGNTEFSTISDFYRLDSHNLNRGGQFAYELFNTFRNPKNAIASILLHLENKKPITATTLENQAKNTPKNYTIEHKKLKSFADFWGYLSEKEQNSYSDLATAYFSAQGIEQTSFEFFFINGAGKTLKAGDYIKLHDPVYGHKFISRVAQASPNGFVTLVDDGGLLTLSAESAQKLEMLDEKDLSKEAKEFFTLAYNEFKEAGEIERTKELEKGAKAYFAKLEADKIAEEKAENAKKKLETSTAKLAELKAIPLKTEADVTALVKKINTNKPNLTKEHQAELTKKIEVVKEKLAKKQAETPKTAKNPETKPTRPRRQSAPKGEATVITPPNAIMGTPEVIDVTNEVEKQIAETAN